MGACPLPAVVLRLVRCIWEVHHCSFTPHPPGLSIVGSCGSRLIVEVAQGDLPGPIEDAGLPLAVAVVPSHPSVLRRHPGKLQWSGKQGLRSRARLRLHRALENSASLGSFVTGHMLRCASKHQCSKQSWLLAWYSHSFDDLFQPILLSQAWPLMFESFEELWVSLWQGSCSHIAQHLCIDLVRSCCQATEVGRSCWAPQLCDGCIVAPGGSLLGLVETQMVDLAQGRVQVRCQNHACAAT